MNQQLVEENKKYYFARGYLIPLTNMEGNPIEDFPRTKEVAWGLSGQFSLRISPLPANSFSFLFFNTGLTLLLYLFRGECGSNPSSHRRVWTRHVGREAAAASGADWITLNVRHVTGLGVIALESIWEVLGGYTKAV